MSTALRALLHKHRESLTAPRLVPNVDRGESARNGCVRPAKLILAMLVRSESVDLDALILPLDGASPIVGAGKHPRRWRVSLVPPIIGDVRERAVQLGYAAGRQ